MHQNCEGMILSQKEMGKGHIVLNFLDSKLGKLRLSLYRVSLDTGLKNSPVLTGSFIEGLISSSPKNPNRYHLSDINTISSIDNIRRELRPMGFTFFMLEILDLLVLEGDIFVYYHELFQSLLLFNELLDETYILFFLAKFLSCEGWLNLPAQKKLSNCALSFVNYAYNGCITSLKCDLSKSHKHELSYFFAHAVKHIKNKMPCSLELLRFV